VAVPAADLGIVFSHSAEGLFARALGGNVPPALRERLRGIGLDLSKKLPPGFPVALWNQVLEATVDTLYPGAPTPRGAFQLGDRWMQGYRTTLVGQAGMAMAKIIGPRRALLRSRQIFRGGNSYTEVQAEELSPSDFRMTFNETGISRWVSQGLLSAGLEFTGAKELSVEVESFTETHVIYRVRWTP
jgi:uncharacterized protein (TIGR02265 family)